MAQPWASWFFEPPWAADRQLLEASLSLAEALLKQSLEVRSGHSLYSK